MGSTTLPSIWNSTLGLPCTPPRPHFPRHSFKARNALTESERCTCNCVLQKQASKSVHQKVQRKAQRKRSHTLAAQQSNAVLDTEPAPGQEDSSVSGVGRLLRVDQWSIVPTRRQSNVSVYPHRQILLTVDSCLRQSRRSTLTHQPPLPAQTLLMWTWTP